MTARATFWKAETEYVLDDYKMHYWVLDNFQDRLCAHLHQNIKNIAYTYFKLKEYDQAATYFQNQIETVKDDKVRLTDSYLRLEIVNL
jgi:tetratricopeptide (TPR) repeat protein